MSTMLVVMLVNGLGRLGQKRPLHLPLSPLLFGWLRTRLCRTCGPHLQCDVQQILCSVGRLDASKPVQLCSQKTSRSSLSDGYKNLTAPMLPSDSAFLIFPASSRSIEQVTWIFSSFHLCQNSCMSHCKRTRTTSWISWGGFLWNPRS